MPNRRILGGWYEFFDDDQQVQGRSPSGNLTASLIGNGAVVATLTSGAPVPPSPSIMGGGGGGGGGGYYPEKGLRKKYIGAMSGASWIVKDVVQTATARLVRSAPATIPKEVSREEVQRGVIRGLRDRITKLEERIRELKAANQVKPDQRLTEELASAMRTVSELQGTVADLAAKLERALVQAPAEMRLPVDLSGVVVVSPPSSSRLWVAGGLWIASELLPKGGKRAKDALQQAAGVLVLSWLSRWLDSW